MSRTNADGRDLLTILTQDQKSSNAVHARLSQELLWVLNYLKEHIDGLRAEHPELVDSLRRGGVIYDHLYAAPFDELCEVRSRLLSRFANAYRNLRDRAVDRIDPDDLARDAVGPLSDELMKVLRLMNDGLSHVREELDSLGPELRPGGEIHDQLYARPFRRVSDIRDSLRIVVNAVYGRKIL